MSYQEDETVHSDESSSGSGGPNEKLVKLLSEAGNDVCADCGSPDPKWVSCNLGVFICIKCSGIHRSLGVHISKVLSAKLDDWTVEQVDMLTELGGNSVVNMTFEACLPEDFTKPKPDASIEERTDFIRKKYEQQQFVNPDSLPPTPSTATSQTGSEMSDNSMLDMGHEKHSKVQRIHNKVHALRQGWRRSWHRDDKKIPSMAGMIEFLGLIKINVVRGTDLVVCDMSVTTNFLKFSIPTMASSDPYVVLSLGNQTVKTRVIKKNLNPVWNEELMLSIPENIPPLKISVYDKDRFTADDFMGEAEVNIRPLVNASRTSESSAALHDHQSPSMQPSDTPKESNDHDGYSNDNGIDNIDTDDDNDVDDDDDDVDNNDLVKASGIITLEDGTVKQEITVKLGSGGSGELQLELECVLLTQ